MSAGGANSAQQPERPQGAGSPRARRFERAAAAIRRGLLLCLCAAVLAFGLGLAWFIWRVPTGEVALSTNAEGIVVLTGGASRISDAVELLAAGRGQRLLITGVYPATHSSELARLAPKYERLFSSRIDLDHSAVNTIGNAVETRRWTRKHGFHSLVVVTSAWHMPRAMAELGHELPDVTLIAFPVITERQRNEPWWSNATTARLLISEYLKYLVALARIHVTQASARMAATSIIG